MNLRCFHCVKHHLVHSRAWYPQTRNCLHVNKAGGNWLLKPFIRHRTALKSTQTTVVTVRTDKDLAGPLCEQEARHCSSLQDLVNWWQHQCSVVDGIGDKFFYEDGGPTAEELKTELNWLLDDAVSHSRSSEEAPWQSVMWRRLEAEVRRPAAQQQGQGQHHTQVLLRAELGTLGELWQQRLEERVPLQYLTATAFWRDIVVAVGPGVLIPRPETEQLIDFAQEAIAQVPSLAEHPWADLGTGSGVLALCLATLLPPSTQVWAVDASPDALYWARMNVQRLQREDRVHVVQGDWCTPLQQIQGKLGGILTNPPYIPSGDMAGLQAEVCRFEPNMALDGGPGSGMNSLNVIARQAAEYLMPGGFLAVETGGGTQAEELRDVLLNLSVGESSQPVFRDITIRSDLFGVERFVAAFKKT